jgi:hypothetical protein
MGNASGKLKCLWLPAQSGKTMKVLERIELFKMLECFGEDNHINFMISANNIILVKQTATRFSDVCIWTHENKQDVKGIAWDILNELYTMVIICSNSVRVRHFKELLAKLDECSAFNKKINIWIDEADANINTWSKHSDIFQFDSVDQVTLVSATFDSVFSKYKRLPVIGYIDTHPECYRCLKDSIKIIVDFAGPVLSYIDHVLTKYPQLTEPGNRAFMPGTFFTSSHDYIADFLVLKYNFAVLIINGKRKELLIPGQDSIMLHGYVDETDEFKEILARIYKENDLQRFPFAITGLECVKRGITFQSKPVEGDHDGFVFDYGIIPATVKKAEAYQLIARLFGNVGDFSNYKQVSIYSTTSNFTKIQKQESMAIHIAKTVYEKCLETVGKEELKEAMNTGEDTDWELVQEEFTNRIDANAFLVSHKCPRNFKTTFSGDFLMSSITKELAVLHYPDVIKELKCFKKTSTFDIRKSVIGKKHSRMYICYKDLEDKDTVMFIVRIIKKIK